MRFFTFADCQTLFHLNCDPLQLKDFEMYPRHLSTKGLTYWKSSSDNLLNQILPGKCWMGNEIEKY